LADGFEVGDVLLDRGTDDQPASPNLDGAELSTEDQAVADGTADAEQDRRFLDADGDRESLRCERLIVCGDGRFVVVLRAGSMSRPQTAPSIAPPTSPGLPMASRWMNGEGCLYQRADYHPDARVESFTGFRREAFRPLLQPAVTGVAGRPYASALGSCRA